ncbi:DUF397 domain-containing protein [Streptomyces ortus]|uniref:DUF397 domain-containing protein n=1 Tax=Streptomyces ortus TaxID=2867268 RepID=A0ABT3V1D9_9ACTN|nr:DUF397 domain-containing protein [Streptomyces ortus]MCX4233825.1 DUF397 domain-containing protein [Streptomyces ortus]
MPLGGPVLDEGLASVSWRKSTYSETGNDNCCEVAFLATEVKVRDSKLPERAVLGFTRSAWQIAVAHFGSPPSVGGGHEHI